MEVKVLCTLSLQVASSNSSYKAPREAQQISECMIQCRTSITAAIARAAPLALLVRHPARQSAPTPQVREACASLQGCCCMCRPLVQYARRRCCPQLQLVGVRPPPGLPAVQATPLAVGRHQWRGGKVRRLAAVQPRQLLVLCWSRGPPT